MGTAYADDIIQKLQEFQRSAHVLLDNVYVGEVFLEFDFIDLLHFNSSATIKSITDRRASTQTTQQMTSQVRYYMAQPCTAQFFVDFDLALYPACVQRSEMRWRRR